MLTLSDTILAFFVFYFEGGRGDFLILEEVKT